MKRLEQKLRQLNIRFDFLAAHKASKSILVKILVAIYKLENLIEGLIQIMQYQIDKASQKVIITLDFSEISESLDTSKILAEIKPVADVRSLCIEWVQGQESHSSYWGKFYVKGIEGIKEEHEANQIDKHHSYQFFVKNLSGKENDIFTIFIQEGNKNGTDKFEFYICQIDAYSHNIISGENRNNGFIEGNFKIIASGIGKTKAPRLMAWWIDNPKLQSLEYAEKCAIAINKRGVKSPL